MQLPGTVVIREDEAAQEQQTRWNVWLERGDEAAGDSAEANAECPKNGPTPATQVQFRLRP